MKKDEMQRVSEWVDEFHGDDAEPFWSHTGDDGKIQECWRRYHLIGEALRRNLASATYRDFPNRVMAQLESEPVFKESPATSANVIAFPHWARKTAGWAIAAGVAMLVITLVPSQLTQSPSEQQIAENSQKTIQTANVPSTKAAAKQLTPSGVPVEGGPSTAGLAKHEQPAPEITLADQSDEMIYIPPLHGIDQYVVRHSAEVSMQSTIPYARIVGYLSEK